MGTNPRILRAITAVVLFTGAIARAQNAAGPMSANPDVHGAKPTPTSIPMSTYSFTATKSNSKKPYTGTLALTIWIPGSDFTPFSGVAFILEKIVQNAAISMSDPQLPRPRLLASLLTRALYEWRVIRPNGP